MESVLRSKHKETVPDNELSITDNIALTESIIKVSGVSKDYTGTLPPGLVIRVYDQTDHADIFAFFYTPAWQAA
jgi:hypothetical protein